MAHLRIVPGFADLRRGLDLREPRGSVPLLGTQAASAQSVFPHRLAKLASPPFSIVPILGEEPLIVGTRGIGEAPATQEKHISTYLRIPERFAPRQLEESAAQINHAPPTTDDSTCSEVVNSQEKGGGFEEFGAS